jgi:hypothetical protein
MENSSAELDQPSEAERYREAMEELRLNQSSLAKRLATLGDRREFSTILRSVQRMANGEARVSGEMQAIVTLLSRDQLRASRIAKETSWEAYGNDGGITATLQSVRLSIMPQSRGRWLIHAQYVGDGKPGYSPPIPHWRSNLEDAKVRAVFAVDETLDHMAEISVGER